MQGWFRDRTDLLVRSYAALYPTMFRFFIGFIQMECPVHTHVQFAVVRLPIWGMQCHSYFEEGVSSKLPPNITSTANASWVGFSGCVSFHQISRKYRLGRWDHVKVFFTKNSMNVQERVTSNNKYHRNKQMIMQANNKRELVSSHHWTCLALNRPMNVWATA